MLIFSISYRNICDNYLIILFLRIIIGDGESKEKEEY